MGFLALVHAGLGLVALAALGAPKESRGNAVRVTAGFGVLAAIALFLLRHDLEPWRGAELDPDIALVGAAAALCAWLMVALGGRARRTPQLAASVGCSVSGLLLFLGARWVAPALLFWLASSLAILVTSRHSQTRLAVALSDAAFALGLAGAAWEAETWRVGVPLDEPYSWLVVAALVLRGGALPGIGIWSAMGAAEGAVLPVALGGAFALVPFARTEHHVWVALGLLVTGIASILWVVVRDRPRLAQLAAWFVALMMATAFIAPAALPRAALGALLAVTVVVLWPASLGRAEAERGLVLAGVPATAAFGALVAAVVVAFERARAADSIASAAPWTAIAALLPAVLAGGVLLGVAVGRRLEPERYEPSAVIGTWLVFAISLIFGAPHGPLGVTGQGRGVLLFAVAVVTGIVAARFAVRRSGPPDHLLHADPPSPGVLVLARGPQRIVGAAAIVVGALSAATAVAFTVAGLRVGFL